MGLLSRVTRPYAPRDVPVAAESSTTRMRTNMPVTLSGPSLTGALLAALAAPALLGGCQSSPKADPGPSASASAAVAPAASASASGSMDGIESRGSDELRPVYPVDAGPPDPLAARFCDAVALLPERRKGECCGATSSAAGLVGSQCVRTLTFALGQHAVTLAPADVDRCVDAVTRATTGCDWVIPNTVALPQECEGVIKGALTEKAQCRSSLECPDGMRCLGLSTIDLGTCGPPKITGSQCNVAVDMLATFTRQDHFYRAHSECQGYCGRARCEDVVATGGACFIDQACGAGRCASGTCTTTPLPAAGEACTDACAAGTHCVKGRCAAPKAEGDACEANAECRGACVREDGGTAGHCAKSCMVFTMPRRPVVAPPRAPVGRPGGPPPRTR
jgi:hypothetical protein